MTGTSPLDSSAHDPLERIGQIGDRMRALRGRLATMRDAWPVGEVFEGEDASGALRVVLTAEGRVSQVVLEDDWRERIGVRSLARAVNQAIGAASARLGDTWLVEWEGADGGVSPQPPRPPRVTLEEYRAVFPAPTSREELRAKADFAAHVREAREARDRGDVRGFAAPGRESFVSPSGRFTATRSGNGLTGLESRPDALATMTDDDVGRDIVAILDEIDRRALGGGAGHGAPAVDDRLQAIRGSVRRPRY
ncbi:MAG: hypothetical protein ACK4MD_11640 [Demequina sp.]